MCCPVLRLDESFATLLALDASSGQRLWSTGMGGGGSTSLCANLYVDASTLIQIGRGRIDGSDHYSVRFHDPLNGQQLALLKFSNSATARGIEPKKTSNYFWVNTGTGRVIDASDYSIYGTSTIYEGIISGQDKLYGVGSANYFTSDKDGTTTTSAITGVASTDSTALIESSGYFAIRYRNGGGDLFGVVSDLGVLLSNSSTKPEPLEASTGKYVAAADFTSFYVIQVWDTDDVASGPLWEYTDAFPFTINGAVFGKPSPDGLSMYVIDSNEREIHKVNSSGIVWTHEVAPAPAHLVNEIQFDADENLYVTYDASGFKFDPSISSFVSVTESFAQKIDGSDGSEIWTTKFYKSEAPFDNGGQAAGISLQDGIAYVYGSAYAN